MSIEVGDNIAQSIVHAIRTSSVHIVILSPNYANSEWCLDELNLMITTGARIIPVFWGVRPSEVRMEDNNGVYARALQAHRRARKFNSRVLNKWKVALRLVSALEGIIYQG